MNERIKEIIEKSGHTFHYQVVNFLREKRWFVLVSPYYRDNVTDKSREIDIVAEKEFDVRGFWGDEIKGTLNVRLFIECKQINQEYVFWFDDKDQYKTIERIIKDTPLKPPKENKLIERHHYYGEEKVAKLFSSGYEKQLESEPIYKAINQCLHGMIYYRNLPSIIPGNGGRKILWIVSYPVIILNSFEKLYAIVPPNTEPSKIENNFLIEINYAYLDENKNSKNEYFLIDVVEFSKFDSFLKNLESNDIDVIRGVL
jgi:hypothetical protein